MSGLSPKQVAALGWVNSTASGHFVLYQNPFEWHEFNGNPKEPEQKYTLKEAIESYN